MYKHICTKNTVSNVFSVEWFSHSSCFHGTKFKAVEMLKDRNRHGKVCSKKRDINSSSRPFVYDELDSTHSTTYMCTPIVSTVACTAHFVYMHSYSCMCALGLLSLINSVH